MNTETQAFNSNESGAYTRGEAGLVKSMIYRGGFRPPPPSWGLLPGLKLYPLGSGFINICVSGSPVYCLWVATHGNLNKYKQGVEKAPFFCKHMSSSFPRRGCFIINQYTVIYGCLLSCKLCILTTNCMPLTV